MAQTEQQTVKQFCTYLKDVYRQQPPPCITEWPLAIDKAFKYTELDITLIQKDECKSVKLDEIFQSIPICNKGRVFLQGSAGSGKSTLVWRASKKWASEEAFTEFELLITLELNDPALEEAKILEDIVPALLEEDRRDIASYIENCDGKNVAFLLDGWDEFQQCKCSYITKLVRGEVLLSASVLVVSRNHPNLSTSSPFLSPATMLLSGFTRDQVLDNLLSSPFVPVDHQVLIGLCSNPLNAAIVNYLLDVEHLSQSSLPSTNTKLMMCFLHHCMLRYAEHEKEADIYHHEDLQQLLGMEEEAKFTKICKLAFSSTLKQKTALSYGDLQAYGIHPENNTELLGLIRKKRFHFHDYYEFNHQTLQELLAAFWIHVEQNHQCMKILLERNPTTMVVPFYAGLYCTTFKYILNTIVKDLDFPASIRVSYSALEDGSHQAKCNRLLTVIKAIYEAQSPDLCNVLAKRVDRLPIHVVHKSPTFTFWYIDDQLQYLHIGYFLANISCLAGTICVDIFDPYKLHAFSANLFAYCLLQAAKGKQLNNLKIALNVGSEVEEGAVAVIAKLISKTSLVSGLRIGWCSSKTGSCYALKSLIAAAIVSSSLKELYFREGLLTKQHVWYLILLMSCSKHLKVLHLSENDIGVGVSLLALLLKQKRNTLTHLKLSACGIGPSQLRCLRKSLKTNSTLEYLDISFNPFSFCDLIRFLKTILNSRNHSLQVLRHSHRFIDGDRITIELVVGAINCSRELKNLPYLRLPHAGEATALVGGNEVGNYYKRTPLTKNVDMMASVIDEVDEPGSNHGEYPKILDDFEKAMGVETTISSSGGACQSTTTLTMRQHFSDEAYVTITAIRKK